MRALNLCKLVDFEAAVSITWHAVDVSRVISSLVYQDVLD